MANEVDITIKQGETYELGVSALTATGLPLDLTYYTASAWLKDDYSAATPVTFTCTIQSPRTSGSIVIGLHYSQSAALTTSNKVWDLFIKSGSVVRCVAQGAVAVSPRVTQTF